MADCPPDESLFDAPPVILKDEPGRLSRTPELLHHDLQVFDREMQFVLRMALRAALQVGFAVPVFLGVEGSFIPEEQPRNGTGVFVRQNELRAMSGLGEWGLLKLEAADGVGGMTPCDRRSGWWLRRGGGLRLQTLACRHGEQGEGQAAGGGLSDPPHVTLILARRGLRHGRDTRHGLRTLKRKGPALW